ncbi:hypothetical protein FA13DRAFT_1708288 [Coprinellus micaceus]|uniref:Uncharacterized protein n=1 Tax=Coprinellus micaceus TaxID=71717 RepID=A0A4Y7THR8_COPMI|nr:hypothetical protein FA13DRAFT_1708288 [Coprinellus micaceus]
MSSGHTPTASGPTGLLDGFFQRRTNGFYQQLVTKMKRMGRNAACSATFGYDFVRKQLWEGNEGFRYPGGASSDACLTFVGEVQHPSHGTQLDASGTHTFVTRSGAFSPLTDTAKVKDRIVLGSPTHATKPLNILFNNQIALLNDIRIPDEEFERKNNLNYMVFEWTKSLDPRADEPCDDLIQISLGNKYVFPADAHKATATAGPPKKRVKRQEVPDGGNESDEDGPPPPPPEPASSASSSHDDVIRVGALYDPATLPDYSGPPCFQLEKKMLLQHDVRDINSRLIHPKDYWTALRPGTLVLVKATLHVYLVKGTGGGRHRKIYQINAVSTKVLGESPHPPLPLPVHSPPTTTTDSNIDGGVDDGFESFSMSTAPLRDVSPWEAAQLTNAAAGPSGPPPSDGSAGPKTDVKGKGKATPKSGKGKNNKRPRDDMEVEDD